MTEMAVETRQRRLVQIREQQSVPIGPEHEVLCRSDVSAGRELGVARVEQRVCKPCEVRTGRAGTQFVNSQRGIKELGQHDVLLSGGKHVMIMRSHREVRASHLLWWKSATSDSSSQLGVTIRSALNRPFEDWARLLGDTVVVTPLLDRLLHHGHLLKFEGKSWRLKEAAARLAKQPKGP